MAADVDLVAKVVAHFVDRPQFVGLERIENDVRDGERALRRIP